MNKFKRHRGKRKVSAINTNEPQYVYNRLKYLASATWQMSLDNTHGLYNQNSNSNQGKRKDSATNIKNLNMLVIKWNKLKRNHKIEVARMPLNKFFTIDQASAPWVTTTEAKTYC